MDMSNPNTDEVKVKVPDQMLCPLTLEIMETPVLTRWGHNFEKDALLRWLQNHGICPLTRNSMSISDIVVNRVLRDQIKAWKARNCLEETERAGAGLKGAESVPEFDPMSIVTTCYFQFASDIQMINALKVTDDPNGLVLLKKLKRERRNRRKRQEEQEKGRRTMRSRAA